MSIQTECRCSLEIGIILIYYMMETQNMQAIRGITGEIVESFSLKADMGFNPYRHKK
jgi:hypothetical protein